MKSKTRKLVNALKSARYRAKKKNRFPSATTAAIVRVSAVPDRPWQIQGEELTILKNAICKGASDTELQYCLTVAKRYRLDPFKRQIWFVSRWDKNADNGQGGTGANVWTPQVGIDGLLFMSARDHKADFGSVSLPDYGPMHKPEDTNIKAPEWAKVKVFKRGVAEPTEAIAYWSEYAPADLSKAPFWRKMPRRMIGKCATALALRQAYPDLGGLYIPEECDRMGEEHTPNGRQIVSDVPTGGSREAAAAVAARIIEEAKQKPTPAPIAPPAPKEREWQGNVELDWSLDEASPILRGDIGNLLEVLKPHCTLVWKGDWWHVLPRDAEVIRQACDQLAFRLKEVMPTKKSFPAEGKGAARSKAGDGPAQAQAAPKVSSGKEEPTRRESPAGAESTRTSEPGPSLVVGTIEKVVPKGKRVDIFFATAKGKGWISSWDTAHHKYLVKGPASIYVVARVKGDKTFVNLVGLKRAAGVEFDSDGKTEVIQQSQREAGTRSMFP